MRELYQADVAALHEIIQPLNIILLSCGNIRARIPNSQNEDAQYLDKKMARIEEQIGRATHLLYELKRRIEEPL